MALQQIGMENTARVMEEPASPIAVQVSNIEMVIGDINENIGMLMQKLQPILGLETVEKSPDSNSTPSKEVQSSVVTETLMRFTYKLKSINRDLTAIRNRVEV